MECQFNHIDFLILIISVSYIEYYNLFSFIFTLHSFYICIFFINIISLWFILKKISIRINFEINYNH